MNIQQLKTFIFGFVLLCYKFIGVVQPIMLSNRKFCGFQHTDDYIRVRNETSIDEFPWLAALIYKFISDGSKAVLCSGALINRRYVLTAAQCLTDPKESVLVGVRLGEYNMKSATDCVTLTNYQDEECAGIIDAGIEEKIVHPLYNQLSRINDLALLRLDRKITEFSDFIRPICLFPPGNMHAELGDILYISGWGRKSHNIEPAEVKKKVYSALISNEQCKKEFVGGNIVDDHICTRDLASNAEFTCQGDAGAPVMFVFSPRRQWHLEGIASWGGPCGSQFPRVHTRVSNYLDWIQDSIEP